MSKFILAYPTNINYDNECKCRNLVAALSHGAEVTKFDYDHDRYNPIRPGIDGVIFFAHGRVIPKEGINKVIAACDKHSIPLYIPCKHDLFPSETCNWTLKRVEKFQRGCTTLEQMNNEDIQEMAITKLIPCMTLPT